MSTSLILQGKAIVNRQIAENQVLVCEDGRIVYVGPKRDEVPDIIVEEGLIVPGYIDIHIHGSNGFDVMDGTEDSIKGISKSLAAYGVTGFLATTLTAGIEHLINVLETCQRAVGQGVEGAELLGVHLEGPWVNVRHKGAQNEQHILPPSLEDARALIKAAGGLLKMVTLAPEHPESHRVIEFLKDQKVITSVGHSDATYDIVKDAIPHGLSHVTHCFNAMKGLHHREPGVVGAAMYHDELTTELIADGIHVHPVAMSILYRLKQIERLVLVSDGMRAVGMGDGEYDLGGLRVNMSNGEARLEDGTLAGSTLTLDQAVKNMVQYCNVSISDAVTMASETPAKVIGFGDRKGHLKAGYDADFLILNDQLDVMQTFVGGKIVYTK